MPKQSPKSVKSGTRKTSTPNKATAKPATTPKAVAKKTSPRTPKESPKAKEAKETLAKIANTKQGKATTPKGKVVSPKASPKSPAAKVVPLDAEASTNLFDTPRASRQASPKASQSPSGKVLSKVAPKGKSASPASKVTNDSPKSAKGKASKGVIANKLSPLPKVASKPTTPKGKAASPKGKAASPKGKAAKGKGSPKAKKPVVEESSSDDEPVEFKTGDLIDAEWEDGLFYSARVIKVNKLKSGTTYDVEFTQDGIQIKKLTREQIQSYSADEDDEPARHRAKVSIDDQDYVDGFVPIPEEDASVESDSTDEPRKRGRSRKQGGGVQKRKRATSESLAEKKRKVHTGLDNMTQKQLVTLVNQVCSQNPKILDTVLERIPEKKLQPAKRGRK